MKCPRCNGLLDPELTCIMCAREYRLVNIISDRRRQVITRQSLAQARTGNPGLPLVRKLK